MSGWRRVGVGGALALLGSATGAWAAGAPAEQASLDHMWTMIAAALVLMMQVGFLLLEAGLVRSKNSINVAQKNIADLVVSIACFWLVGFAVMFGASQGGWIGWSSDLTLLDGAADWTFTFFVFQAVFCGTAATIVSGAVAERMRFAGYFTATVAIALLIYPVFGHWAWGDLLIGENTAWLADKGFVDFAGSTVVHSVGAWVALAAIIVIGPRLGRFDAAGRPVTIQGHSPVLAASGAIILFVGWIGFNGGSTTAGTPAFASIVANTVIAAVFGGFGAMLFGYVRDGFLSPDRSINGLLGGLVAVTAGCDVLTGSGAALVGVGGGIIALASHEALLRWFKLDDVVGAIGVHGVAGAFGTIVLALLAPVDALPLADRWAQTLVQTEGVLIAFAFAFGVSFVLLKAVSLVSPLRVTAEEEIEGLNRAEHRATLGAGHLQAALADLLKGDADFSTRIAADPGDEAGELAALFNELLARLDSDAAGQKLVDAARRDALERAAASDRDVVAEINALIARASDGDLNGRLTLAAKTGLLREVGEGVNRLLARMGGVATDLEGSLSAMADGDLSQRMAGQRGGAFGAMSDSYNRSVDRLSASIATLAGATRDLDTDAKGLKQNAEELATGAIQQREGAADAQTQLEETRVSLGSAVAAAAANAREASQMAASVAAGRAEADQATEAMQTLVSAMEQARSIVETIDAISSQTNMLAINAAVEAARAGPAGKQFSVVAQEVRSLSLRVSEASSRVTEIIDGNAALTAEGAEHVAQIHAALGRIDAGAARVTEAADVMSSKLAQDANRLDHVTRTMTDLASAAAETAGLAGAVDGAAGRAASLGDDLRRMAEAYHLAETDMAHRRAG